MTAIKFELGADVCRRPDRDAPKLLCGHPLPCPHHTVTMTENWVYSPVDLPEEALDRLEEIGRAIFEESS